MKQAWAGPGPNFEIYEWYFDKGYCEVTCCCFHPNHLLHFSLLSLSNTQRDITATCNPTIYLRNCDKFIVSNNTCKLQQKGIVMESMEKVMHSNE